MEITYNPKAKKLVINCNFAENSLIADLPNKRFQSRTRVWHVPPLARNCAILLERFRDVMSPEALEVAEKSANRARPQHQEFPAWYKPKTTPFPHQSKALDHAWGLDRYALFMEMGTGKSKVAVDLNCARFMTGEIDLWVVFCPNSIRDNWVDEIALHSPVPDIPVFVIRSCTASARKKIERQIKAAPRAILIVGMESIQSRLSAGTAFEILVDAIVGRKFSVTIDESHLVKGHEANRSKNVELITSAAQVAGIMTGTPTSQGILDLFMQFQILDPNIIGVGDFYSFRSRYAEMGGYENRQVVGYKNVEELMALIRPYVYQCTKDVLDLPEKLYTRRVVEMTPEQARVYKELDRKTEAEIRDLARKGVSIEVVVGQALAKYNALQQVTGGFVNYDDYSEDGLDRVRRSAWIVEPEKNPKVRELVTIAQENPDRPIIIWAKFRNEIAQIEAALEAEFGADCVASYHGGVTPEGRHENIARFKSGGSRFFVANQMTGGMGLTINESNLVVYFSNSLKLTERLQSEDRNHRIGQKNSVLYIDLVCAGTKDVDVLQAVRDKRDVAEYIRDQMQRR